MKQIKSIALLMMVFLTVALTGPTTARAAIPLEGRNEIVAVFTTMIGRAPSATELAELVAMADSGKKLVDVAQRIATRTDFATQYPGFLTADEFSEKLTNDLLGDNTPAENKAQARDWVVGQLKSGVSVASVIVGAVQAIRNTTSTAFLAAKEALSAKVSAAVSSLNAPAPENQSTVSSYYAIQAKTTVGATSSAPSSATSSTVIDSSKIGEILKDLREIAEDLKIEEEDGSAYFKGGLQQATDKVAVLEAQLASAPESERAALQSQLTQARTDLDTLSKSPSEAYKKLQALETELTSATTDAQRQAVIDKLTEIQRTLTPWLGFAGNNPGTPNSTRNLTDEGLRNLRAINDRVVTGLTGAGKTCRTRYNSNTHAYELVCN